ncbi:SRPBCC family protein [Carboxylicivirga sp. RSCT41]|uniref:SRPBCC family protein n=1 Tax=Carboxylicivirga agarovorans TaxID=3417570 RepID=UPI003D33DBE5
MKEIIIQAYLPASLEQTWHAITDVDEMRQWFFDNIPAFEAKAGFETRFLVDAGERQFMHVWHILEVKEQQLIKYRWTYEGYKGVGYVTFRLSKVDDMTLLLLTSEGLDSFKPQVPEFTRESCTLGWKYFINERLKSYIAKAKH